jgi:hypothetical protein
MSRASANPAKRVDPAQAKPGDVLSLYYRDSWAATRFALPPFHTSQMRYAVRHQVLMTPGLHFYRIDGLTAEKRGALVAFLAEHKLRFEVWR